MLLAKHAKIRNWFRAGDLQLEIAVAEEPPRHQDATRKEPRTNLLAAVLGAPDEHASRLFPLLRAVVTGRHNRRFPVRSELWIGEASTVILAV